MSKITFQPLVARSRANDDNTLIVAKADRPFTEIAVLRADEDRDYSDADKELVAYAQLFAAAPQIVDALNAALTELREASECMQLNSFDHVVSELPESVKSFITVDLSQVYG
jgi:hypothetical protein